MVRVTGVTMSPPIAPTAALSAKESMTTRRTSMPMSRAASRSVATARIARPRSVRSKKRWSASTIAAATPRIQRAWGTNVAPSMRNGRSPVKAGRPAAFLPRETMTPPLMRIEAPMVTMMRLNTSAWRTGRITSRSISTPTAVTAATVTTNTTTSGRPVAESSAAPSIPPSIENSPWAKFTAPVALKTTLSPSATRA